MKLVAAIAVLVAAVLIACSSELTAPQTKPASTTVPTATTAPTEAPAEQTTTEPTPPPSVDPTEAPAATAQAAPTPEPTSPSTDVPQSPTGTLAPTPTAVHTSEIKLLKVRVAEIPDNLPDYDRHDWKHWTDADGDCQDARNEVLVAESQAAVSYRTDRRCSVAGGEWLTPYSNTVVTDPGKLDVDHMVPLGNAHASGASNWSAEQRERYANYLDDPQHLIAVTASANRSKGARGPEAWKPDDEAYWCQYAIDWISIKDTWDLTVNMHELDALSGMLDTCANPPDLRASERGIPINPRPTNGPHYPTPTPMASTYSSCDAAEAAGETRVQGNEGSGRGFPKRMVPSARDGDGDGMVCEK